MWTSQYDIIVETLTGSEFEVSVTDEDTVGYIKSRIQKYEGIPINQQHLIYNQKELNDATEVKDIPLVKGSRLKLVLGLKGGPVSARRVVTLPDFDTTWFDLSDVLNTSRQDPLTISSPGVKLLVYKDCKKNIHRVMKFRADRKNANNANSESAADLSVDVDGQFLRDNLTTMEKMHQLRTQLELKKKDKQNSKLNVPGGDVVVPPISGAVASGSFGEQCVNNLMKMTKNENERRRSDATNSGAAKKDNDHVDYWNVSSPIARRMYFPPLKIPGDGQVPFKKPVDGSAMLKKPIRNEFTSFTNEFSNYPIVGSMLNKHGTAKTCLRSSMLTQKQKPTSEASPSTAELVSGAALFDPDPSPADADIFRKKSTGDPDEAMKTKAFGQHIIELIRTSKMPLSPSWQDISEAKAKFEATFVPSMAAGATMAKKSSSSDAIATAGTSSTTSLNEVLPLSQSMTTMATAASATRNFTNSEVHRSKIRDNIRRNRSFKALISSDYIIEENNHHNHHPHHQQQHHHQYQTASSTAAASLSSFNSSRQYSSSAKKSKMPFNSVQDLLEKFNSSTKLKGNNGHGNAVGGYNCYYNDVRSNESLSDFAKSATAPFPSPLRANSSKSSLLIDLKSQFDNNEIVKCNRRMSTPKISYNGYENKLFVENPSTSTAVTATHQHHHASIGSCDKRKSFSGGEYKFDGASATNASGPAAATSIGSSATATAIADNSSFRVFKMAADAKNYELPKLLIREGSPIESFHSSHPQLETLALRCDSPINIIDTLAAAAPNPEALTISTAPAPSSSPPPSTTSQLNALLTSTEMPRETTARLGHHHSDLSLNNLELNFLNDEDLTAGYATNYLKKSASVLKIASNQPDSDLAAAFRRDSPHYAMFRQNLHASVSSGEISPKLTEACRFGGNMAKHSELQRQEDRFIGAGDVIQRHPNDHSFMAAGDDECAESTTSKLSRTQGANDTNNNNIPDNSSRCSSISSNNSNNNSCERLHNATKSKSVELNEFRVIFGSSPTLLNYNQVGPTSRLDAIPSQYRRGYANLNDACMSSSTSDLPRGSGGSAGTKKSIKRTDESASHQINTSTMESVDGGNGISHEISSLLRHRSDGPLDYVRSYENLDRAKIIRMKNDKRNSLSGGNYNCTHSQSSSGHGFGGGGGGGSGGSGNSNNGTIDTGGGGSSVQDWKYNNHFDHFNDQRRIVQEEDSGDDYSYSNLGYDNAYGAVGYSIGDYQSNESLFNINFDAMDDEVFEIDAMGLFENDLTAPNTELLLDEKCSIYDGPFSNGKNATAIQMDGGTSNRLLLPDVPQPCSRTDEVPVYQFNSEHLVKSNVIPSKNEIIVTSAGIGATSITDTSADTVDGVETTAIALKATTPVGDTDAAAKPKKLRCAECNKKLGLIMIMKCHCERIFCAQHRYAEAHRCSYNFKTEGQKTIARENPLVVAPKLPKI